MNSICEGFQANTFRTAPHWEALLSEVADAVLVSVDEPGGLGARTVYGSPVARSLLALNEHRLHGADTMSVFGPLADRHALARLRQALARRIPSGRERLCVGVAGHAPVWVEVHHTPLGHATEGLRAWVLHPIDGQRAALVALAESEARLADLGRAAHAFTFRARLDRVQGAVVDLEADPHAQHLKPADNGLPPSDLILGILGPSGWSALQAAWLEAANREAPLDWVAPSNARREVWRVIARPQHADPACWQGVCMEVTERERIAGTLSQAFRELERVTVRQEQLLELERRRIARQLHDELGQLLNAARLEVGKLHQQGCQGNLEPDTLDRLDELLGRATQSTRQMVRDLRPPVLDLGLVAALEALRDDFKHRHGLNCRLVAPDDIELAPFAVHAIYRLVEAAMDNVRRHAQSASAQLTLRLLPQALSVSLADNGPGFDTLAAVARGGLQRMKELSLALEAEYSVMSQPGGGTRVALVVPLRGEVTQGA